MSTKHEFQVEMTCGGCSGAVTRILTKNLTGPNDKFEVKLEDKKVFIESDLPQSALEELLKKSGKEVKYIGTNQ